MIILHVCLSVERPIWLRWDHVKGAIAQSFSCPRVAGGILADEMGLGKTVQVIALMLADRDPELRPSSYKSMKAGSYEPSEKQKIANAAGMLAFTW